jgi:hypothetical protein
VTLHVADLGTAEVAPLVLAHVGLVSSVGSHAHRQVRLLVTSEIASLEIANERLRPRMSSRIRLQRPGTAARIHAPFVVAGVRFLPRVLAFVNFQSPRPPARVTASRKIARECSDWSVDYSQSSRARLVIFHRHGRGLLLGTSPRQGASLRRDGCVVSCCSVEGPIVTVHERCAEKFRLSSSPLRMGRHALSKLLDCKVREVVAWRRSVVTAFSVPKARCQ